MARVLAIDYGTKRVGIAVTDPLQLIANSLTTIHSKDLISFLKTYLKTEEVECILIGEPKTNNNEPSQSEKYIEIFINTLKKEIPTIAIKRVDERFTSKIAFQTMIDGGLKKKERQNKELVDAISATIILQTYLESKQK